MRRSRQYLVLALTVALGVGGISAGPAQAAPSAPSPASLVTTVTLSGTYSDSAGNKGSQHFCGQTYAYTIKWSETASTTDENLDNGVPVHWHFTTLTGTSKLMPDDSPACADAPSLPPACSAPITLRPGWEDSDSGEAGISKVGEFDGSFVYNTYGYPPEFGETTQSTCGDRTGPFDDPGTIGGPYKIEIDQLPGGMTKVVNKPVDVDTETPAGDGTAFRHTHGTATLRLAAAQTGVKPPTNDQKARAARKAAKAAAKADLGPALENAKGPCLTYAFGLGQFGAGTLLIGAPALGPVLTVAGSLSALAAEPFCVATITRIAKDYRIYNDPPDVRVHLLAEPERVAGIKLPACKQRRHAVRTFCVSLSTALKRWVVSGQHVASTVSALSTTVNRLTSAINSHNASGEATQTKQVNTLLARLRHDKRVLRSAGRALATVYRQHKLKMPVSHARASHAVHFILQRLAPKHVSGKQLRKVSAGLVSTRAFDGLKALSAG